MLKMLCPEGEIVSKNENIEKEGTCRKNNKKNPVEGTGSLELSSFKNPKTWKKSITNFFRHQLRSTKSIDVRISSIIKYIIVFMKGQVNKQLMTLPQFQLDYKPFGFSG